MAATGWEQFRKRITIVGGRPAEPAPVETEVPAGLENLLRMAAEDDHLRAALLEDRSTTVEACQDLLSDGELAVLRSVPREQLEPMIARLRVPQPERREFLKVAAAALMTLVTGAAAWGADPTPSPRPRPPEPTRGIRPDRPDLVPSPNPSPNQPHPHPAPTGIRPDRPPVDASPRPPGSAASPSPKPEPPRTIRGTTTDRPPGGNKPSPRPPASPPSPSPRPEPPPPTRGIQPDRP